MVVVDVKVARHRVAREYPLITATRQCISIRVRWTDQTHRAHPPRYGIHLAPHPPGVYDRCRQQQLHKNVSELQLRKREDGHRFVEDEWRVIFGRGVLERRVVV